jgi:hypothetical protein
VKRLFMFLLALLNAVGAAMLYENHFHVLAAVNATIFVFAVIDYIALGRPR